MNKHLLGETIGSKIESSRISFLIFFFFLSSEILPQIPINGFCKFNSFQFSSGYSKLFSLNYNNDSYSDLIFFDPFSNIISAVPGDKKEMFAEEKKYDFPFVISNLASIKSMNNEIKMFAFTSRKNLVAGICEFAIDGKPKVKHQFSFKSYPEKLSTADIDGDDEQEILISGPAFEGLSLLKLSDGKINETKITSKGSYSDAIFIDLSNDGFPDITALNLINNSLELFVNDRRGNFKVTRSIQLNQKASNLHSFDMNLDSYQDLILTEGNSIKIIYGDFASSYSKQIEIYTKHSPNDFIIGDFNKDGKIDLAYLNWDVSVVSVIFSSEEIKFFPETFLFRKEGIKSIIPFYSKFIDGLAVLCEDGTLLTNTRLLSFSSDNDISLSINPIDITYFDANSDEINDICFIDDFDNSLKLIVRNNAGIPAVYYSIPLRGKHNQIEVNSSRQSTEFFCYSQDRKLIEVVNIEFRTGKIIRNDFYTSKPISRVKSSKNDNSKLLVSSLTNNKLFVEIFEKEETWKLLSDYFVAEKIIGADLFSLKNLKLLFWKYDNDSVKLYQKTFLPEELKAEMILKLQMKNISNFFTISDDFFNLEKESLISFVEMNEKKYILINRDQVVNIFNIKDLNEHLKIASHEQIFIGEIRKNGTRRLFVNNHSNQTVYKLNILRNGTKIIFVKIRDNVACKKYFIKNLTINNYHLVYLNQAKGCISSRQI